VDFFMRRGNVMKASLLYRIASVVLILFAAGHTFGFLGFRPPTPEGIAVFDAMNQVHFEVQGASYSYGAFYRGFGLFVSVYLVFAALLAWHLGGLAREMPQAIGALGWMFFVVQLASLGLGWVYFSAAPAAFSAVAAICVGWAAWQAPARQVA
jgi:hypothetical protein